MVGGAAPELYEMSQALAKKLGSVAGGVRTGWASSPGLGEARRSSTAAGGPGRAPGEHDGRGRSGRKWPWECLDRKLSPRGVSVAAPPCRWDSPWLCPPAIRSWVDQGRRGRDEHGAQLLGAEWIPGGEAQAGI